MKRFLIPLYAAIILVACNQQASKKADTTASANHQEAVIACPPGESKLDIAKIEQITGMKGVEKNGHSHG